jgi:hypothetical protein
VYDHRWRVVAEHVEDETEPRVIYVYHAAGLDGMTSLGPCESARRHFV